MHVLKRVYKGKGIEESITPTCSCGWQGCPEFAYDDYQYTNVKEQEVNHIRST